MRQRAKSPYDPGPYDPGPGISIASLAYDYPPQWRVPEHAHASDQLIYAISGVMEVAADGSLWLIPPQFAVWIPARVRHALRMPGAVSMRTLYLRPGLARGRGCAVLHITPLLRELIVEAVRIGDLRQRNAGHAALREVILAQIDKASPVPTMLVMPTDPRARILAEATIADPRSHRGPSRALAAQCRKTGVSLRTMQRIFRREVGMDFETWRRQARLMKAVELLAEGRSIKSVSHAVGYRQASTFVAMFRKSFGLAPRAWISALKEAS
ncbi:MAG TPA: helix-turn-helix transcriptional regulator [Rhizomicrobium sp.]|jgi:AraC-like DNA-binding protein/mannose-6-phosphate isomerase-like protein (cupin superfamily)